MRAKHRRGKLTKNIAKVLKMYIKCDTMHIIVQEVLYMAKTDTLHIRIEPTIKEKAEVTLNELGLSITEAVNVFLRQVILNDGIPFEIKKPVYNKETIQALEDVKNGKNVSKAFDNVEEMFEELDKQCYKL